MGFLGALGTGVGGYFGGSLGSAIGGAIGSSLDSDESERGVASANDANIAQAQKQMDFQQSMSNTAHQREVADLKAAGLNPMLSAKLGGASAPLGASAQIQDTATPAINTGMASARLSAELDNIKAQTEASKAQARKSDSEAAVNAVMIPKVQQDTITGTSSAKHLDTQVNALNATIARTVEEVSNLKSTNAQIQAATAKIIEETKNLPVTRAQIGAAIQEAASRIKQQSSVTNLNVQQLPRAKNEAAAQQSWWMRNVSPYLPDILKSSSSAKALSNLK